MTSCMRPILYGTEIMTFAETVRSWPLFKSTCTGPIYLKQCIVEGDKVPGASVLLVTGNSQFLEFIYRVFQKICWNPGNSTLLVLRLILFLSGFLIRRKINAARIVLFKSTIKLNNFSSDKKHNL